ATVPPAPHPRSAGSTATDDLLEPAPRSSRSRTAHRSSHPNRASDVPHISSRSADYTPTPGPIERLFPHPVKEVDPNLPIEIEFAGTGPLDCITERTDEHGYWWRYQHSNDEPRDTLTAAITIAGEVAANEARKSG